MFEGVIHVKNIVGPSPLTSLFSSPTSTKGRVAGDDSEFILDIFENFVMQRTQDKRKFVAHLSLHSIHEPHPSMPEYYHLYPKDPDYLGTLTQLDMQIGRLVYIFNS